MVSGAVGFSKPQGWSPKICSWLVYLLQRTSHWWVKGPATSPTCPIFGQVGEEAAYLKAALGLHVDRLRLKIRKKLGGRLKVIKVNVEKDWVDWENWEGELRRVENERKANWKDDLENWMKENVAAEQGQRWKCGLLWCPGTRGWAGSMAATSRSCTGRWAIMRHRKTIELENLLDVGPLWEAGSYVCWTWCCCWNVHQPGY